MEWGAKWFPGVELFLKGKFDLRVVKMKSISKGMCADFANCYISRNLIYCGNCSPWGELILIPNSPNASWVHYAQTAN